MSKIYISIRNTSILFLLFFLAIGNVQAQYSGTGVFTKVTAAADLTDGYYVIAYGTTYAMNNSYVSPTYLDRTAIAPAGGVTITNPSTAIVWKVETNGSGKSIYNEATAKYISYTGGSNNLQVVDAVTTNNQRWSLTYGGGVVVTENLGVSGRDLQYNTQSPRFACYTGSQQDLTFYKLPVPSIYYWDVSTGTGLGGSGTWGTTFNTAVAGTGTLVTAPITAQTIFQGTAGTVGLTAATTEAASLTFNVGNYIISTVSAGAKVLNGDISLSTNNITFSPIAGSTISVSDVITGTTAAANTALTKTGAGNLLFPGAANTFTGKLVINQGYIGASGESRFGATPGAFTPNQITLNGGGILASGGAINFSSNRGITLGASGGLFDATGGTITLTNVVTGTGSLTATAGTVLLAGIHTYTGNTIVKGGTLQLGINNAIAGASNVELSGGTFRTGASTGFSDVVGTLNLTANSTFTLGTGVHTFRLNNSSAVTWAGTTLSITGWTGVAGGSGTAGRIYVGTDATGLTDDQLAKITFSGFTAGAMLRTDGELVPAIPAGTITLSPATQALGSYCNAIANTISITYTVTGTVTDPFIELSSAAGSFAGATTDLGGTVSGSGTFTITGTLPAGTAAGTAYRVRIKSTNSIPVISANNNSNIIIIAAVTPTVTIAANPTGAVCAGNNITFTATPANLGGGTVNATTGYQWKIGGVDVAGQTANTFTTSTLTNGQQVSCVISITGGCVTNATPSSNTINANITTPVTPTVTISQTSGTNPICTGASATFTATAATLGGGTVATNGYQWKINGINVAGQTAATFSTTTLNNNDDVSCSITVTNGCITSNTAQSGDISMTVMALPLAPTGTITASNNPSCGPATLTYNNSTPEAGVTYYWQTTTNGTSVVTNAGTTNYIVNATTTNIYVRGRNATGCWGPSIASGPITINTAVSTSNPTNQNVIVGANATFTTTASGTGPFTYQWQVNTGAGFGNVANGGVYGGVNTASLSITGATLAMTGYTYQVIVTGTCGTATSGIATLTVSTLNIPIVVNEIFAAPFNTGKSYVELLVLQNNLDMRGWIVRDYNPSGNDGAGGWGSFQFASTSAWQSVPAGTLITVLSSGYAAADEDIDISDGILALKANNTTYPINYTFSSASPPNPQGFAFSPTTDAAIISNASGVAQHGLGYFNNTNPSEVPQLAAAPYWSSYDLGSAVTSSTTLGATIRFVNTVSVADFDLGENNSKVAFVQGATPATIKLPNDVTQTTFIAAQRGAVDFRSRASGNYYDRYAPWEANNGTGWAITGGVPSSLYRSVEIRSGHTISYPAVTMQSPKIDEVIVRSGGTLANTSTSGLKIANGSGTDLLVEGTYIDNGNTSNPIVFDAGATWALGTTGTIVKTAGSAAVPYRDNYEGGMSTIPEGATWIIRQTGTVDVSFTTINTFYPNLIFEKTTAGMWAPAIGSSRFTGNSSTTVIKGGLDVGGTGAGNVTIYDENYHPNPLLINGNLRVKSGSILTNAGTTDIGTGIEVKGNVVVDGTLTINTNGKGLLKFSGAADQSVTGTGTNNMNIWDLSFANPANLVIPYRSMNVYGHLKMENNSGLRFETGDIYLKSSAGNTASVSPLPATNISYPGTGRFIVERFIGSGLNHGRSWQFVSTPVQTEAAQSIFTTWQENNVATPGLGVWLTSPNAAAGFDSYTAGPSIKFFNAGIANWQGVANTGDPLADQRGYMLFVRGDRSATPANSNINSTTLRTKGKIYTADVTQLPPVTNVSLNGFASVGNPFASAINLINVSRVNLTNEVYIWDPTLGGQYGLGAYRTLTLLPNGLHYIVTPAGGAYPAGVVDTLQSGQAFFVKGNSLGSSSISFSEAAKVDATKLVHREGNFEEIEMFSADLYTNDSMPLLTDGALAIFDARYGTAVDPEDGIKLLNGTDNAGFRRNGQLLAVERRPSPVAGDTLYLSISNTRPQGYHWKFTPHNMGEVSGRGAWLWDKYLDTKTPLNLSSVNNLPFEITGEPASAAADRFAIVFEKVAAPLPVTITGISAVRNTDNSIAVKWTVENESNIAQYIVECSSDGQAFTAIATKAATNSKNYLYNDRSPLAADNYYRIKAIGINGSVQYSSIVKVSANRQPAAISVYPNPVVNKTAQLQFTNQEKGTYSIELTNKLGQVIYKGSAAVTSGNFSKSLDLGSNTAAGIYQLKVISEIGVVVVMQMVVE